MKYLAIGVAAVFALIGVLYLAGVLQIATSDPAPGKHHISHGALFLVLAVLAGISSRFVGKAPAQ